jgi:hypothetical protein
MKSDYFWAFMGELTARIPFGMFASVSLADS